MWMEQLEEDVTVIIINMIVQPAMLYGMDTVPMNSSHVNKLKVAEMKMC